MSETIEAVAMGWFTNLTLWFMIVAVTCWLVENPKAIPKLYKIVLFFSIFVPWLTMAVMSVRGLYLLFKTSIGFVFRDDC